LKNLNNQLERINSAKNKAELKEIEIYLDGIVISEFGSKSAEAGFILNQLKLTCSMASRLMKDEEEKPVEAPKMETTPITDDFLNELKETSNEPVKKVVIEEPVVVDEKTLEIKEPVVVDEKTLETPVQENAISTEMIKASDDDVIAMLDNVSTNVINDVISLIDERTKSLLNNAEAFYNLDFSEHKELIYSEVRKRVGILLNK
jgi:hypothetical protein